MGIERYLMWVLKASDIRNMQICLRFNGKIYCHKSELKNEG